jgi:hypothetical protein
MARLELRMPEGDTIARLPSVVARESYWLPRSAARRSSVKNCRLRGISVLFVPGPSS